MTALELDNALRELQLTPSQAARWLAVSRQAIWYWRTGQRAIPGPVETAIKEAIASAGPLQSLAHLSP